MNKIKTMLKIVYANIIWKANEKKIFTMIETEEDKLTTKQLWTLWNIFDSLNDSKNEQRLGIISNLLRERDINFGW